MRPPLICAVWLLGVALIAVGCGGKQPPEQWQKFMNEVVLRKAAQAAARMPAHRYGSTSANKAISECRDGGPEYDYVCKRTYDVEGAQTTETVGYTVARTFWGKDWSGKAWSEHLLTQTHECPNGSVRPGIPGC
jgi:hypothetical protein